MHDLLMVLKPLSIHIDGVGRRNMRPGAIVEVDPTLADQLVRKGYCSRVQPAAPLFAQEPEQPAKPMRRRKEPPNGR